MCFMRRSPGTADEHALLIPVDAGQKNLGTKVPDPVHDVPIPGLTERCVDRCSSTIFEKDRPGLRRRTQTSIL